MKEKQVETLVHTQKLPLTEAFYSIQGEGYHQGKAAYFIRLAGCDVGCHWCDVKESWDEADSPMRSVVEMVKTAVEFDSKIVIVTGGEPLMHDLTTMTEQLHQHDFRTHLETSGAHPLTGNWDWITFSPKKFKAPLPEIYDKAHELKIVIYNRNDFEWAEEFAARVNSNCKLYLQPEWSKIDEMLPSIIDYVKTNTQWQISMQVHKYLNVR